MKFLLTLKSDKLRDVFSIANLVSSASVEVTGVHSALGMIEVIAQPDALPLLQAMNIFESIEPVSSVKIAPPGSEIQ